MGRCVCVCGCIFGGTKNMMTSSNGNIFRVTGPLCGEFTGPGEFPTQRPVTRSFDVFLDLRLNKWLSKQWWGWWFETPSWSLWRHRNENIGVRLIHRHWGKMAAILQKAFSNAMFLMKSVVFLFKFHFQVSNYQYTNIGSDNSATWGSAMKASYLLFHTFHTVIWHTTANLLNTNMSWTGKKMFGYYDGINNNNKIKIEIETKMGQSVTPTLIRWLNSQSRWHHNMALLWRNNGGDGISNHQPHDCLLDR